jgi:hypothetical protein
MLVFDMLEDTLVISISVEKEGQVNKPTTPIVALVGGRNHCSSIDPQ